MDDLLREFLTETAESLDLVDAQMVRFEQDPNDSKTLANIFRLVHTIKGTCGFLGLSRLEALAHAAETLMGKFRDGMPVSSDAVTLILRTIDRIKVILAALDQTGLEPEGEDADLIAELERRALAAPEPAATASPSLAPEAEEAAIAEGHLVYQVLERPLRPGEVSLDDLERAFRETAGPADAAPAAQPAMGDAPREGESAEIKSANQTIRVNVDTLEHLMTMVSELVLTRNQLLDIVRRQDESEFKVPLLRLSNVTTELQESVMKTRMQPIRNAWQKLPRIVRDLTNELGKQIDLQMKGEETELDRQVLELIKDPLTHMVRNSADHGIEMPEDRRAAGKPEAGTIRLSAHHEGGHIILEIADDGRGLNTDRIRAKAVANGLATESEVAAMSDSQVHAFIFAPGFSTAAQVSSVSGRGVGMDVVRTNIDEIGGTIDVASVPGKGSTFTVKIPLTLAIVPALIVTLAEERFAIPQTAVVELVRARPSSECRIEQIMGTAVLRLRDKLLPLVHLKQAMGMSETADVSEDAFIVIVQVGSRLFGIVVDGVLHTEEIVVKPMSSRLRAIDMFSGVTILGDGSVIVIIDPNGVSKALGQAGGQQEHAGSAEGEDVATSEQPVSMLLFRANGEQPKAVPLSLVTRIEKIDATSIEISNGNPMLQYRGQLMPLVPVDGAMTSREGMQPVLVFSESGKAVGLLVDEIVDIVSEKLNIEIASERPGSLGSAVIKNKTTEILDVSHYLSLGYPDWLGTHDTVQAKPEPILLVDDSAFFRNMLTPVLKAAGYQVTVAPSAADAIQILRGGKSYAAIVTDVEMPEMDGFTFGKVLQSDPRMAQIPVIGLSALVSPQAMEQGRAAGFRHYVAKFDRPGLLAALKQQSAPVAA